MQRDSRITALFEAYLRQRNLPDPVDFRTFCGRHPRHARELRALWSSLRMIELLGIGDEGIGGNDSQQPTSF